MDEQILADSPRTAACRHPTSRSGTIIRKGKKVAGEWFGIGAESLGLSRKVAEAKFLALCENEHPRTSNSLTQRKNVIRQEVGETKANRRILDDFTFSRHSPATRVRKSQANNSRLSRKQSGSI